jgi:uncharacterized coiled-coil protein SlyX
MKKLLAASLVALVLVLAFSSGAEARCNLTCLGNRVKGLTNALTKAQKTIAAQERTIAQQGKAIADLNQKVSSQGQAISSQGTAISAQGQAIKQVNTSLGCLFEAPLTQYGEPEGPLGYLFQYEEEGKLETIPTTALDVTYAGDEVHGWALFDGCNTAEFASAASSGAIAPIGALAAHPPVPGRLP